MPELTVAHGGKVRAIEVDRVYRIARGKEAEALEAMRHDGADNIVFKGDSGDLYIASRIGQPARAEINDRVSIPEASRVEFKGVMGTLLGFDNETNELGEAMKTRGAIGAAVGGGLGVLGIGLAVLKFGLVSLNPLLAIGVAGGLGLAGFIAGSLMQRKPDFDKLDRYAAGMELA